MEGKLLLDDWGSIPDRVNDGTFAPRHHFQTGSVAHPASYPIGTGISYPEGEAAGAWSWLLSSI